MSTNNIVLNNGNQAIINTDLSKIFLRRNRYETANYNNSAYDAETIYAGTVMGRVASTGFIKKLASGASDGSQFPCGVLANDHVVDGGDIVPLSMCVAGDIAEEKLIFQGTDSLDTTISSRRLRDRMAADTAGIILVPGTDNTIYDNQ